MTVPNWWNSPRTVTVVVDNPSWILHFAEDLVAKINQAGDRATLVRSYRDVVQGAVSFFLGCVGVAPEDVRSRNRATLVVHESELPEGRGFSPLTWQILEGRNTIPICLVEAAAQVDAGRIIYKDELRFEGHELKPELRTAQGEKTIELCLRYLAENAPPRGLPQAGEATHYPRRCTSDGELDPYRTIAEQFDHLRVADNSLYPAFFEHRGNIYRLRIDKIKCGASDDS